jgi:gliding motility-associated-like protein
MFMKLKLLGLLCIFIVTNTLTYGQSSYTLSSEYKNEECNKGSAGIKLEGLQTNDTLLITWSNNQTNVYSINELSAGNYSVNIEIKNKLDTTITFKIQKEKCKVAIPNHFTPNDDNYNDLWRIALTEFYPNFELYVFNKWGQQVHSQKGSYTPWDGKWNGINVLDGTYYYVFYYDGGNKNDLIKGDVTILR